MQTFKVLANDGLDKQGIDLFRSAGIEVDTEKKDPSRLLEVISNYDALIVRSATEVTCDILEVGASGLLKVIGRAGVGYDNIDVDSATKNNVVVKIAPHGNTNATAELTIGLMFSLARRINPANYSLHLGVWKKKEHVGSELAGKSLGIIGYGRIGQRVAGIARTLPMNILAYDPYQRDAPGVELLENLDDLLQRSDYVTIHAGGDKEIIGAREIGLMKPSAYLINAARGVNVNPEALYDALSQKKIAGAAIDAHYNEPLKDGMMFSSGLRNLDNVVLTPHLGASTPEAQRKTSIEIAEVIIGYLLRGDFEGAVNVKERVQEEGRKVYQLFIAHQDIPGMFGRIHSTFGEHGINIRETPSRSLDGKVMTVCLLHQEPTAEVISALSNITGVYSVK